MTAPQPDGLSAEARHLLTTIATTSPEWQAWLRLIEEALRGVQTADWVGARPPGRADPTTGAPGLANQALAIDVAGATAWVGHLFTVAAGSEEPGTQLLEAARRAGRLPAPDLLAAGVNQDADRLVALARSAEVDAAALSALVHLAILPVLRAAGPLSEPVGWSAGYCPTCGAWPTLAEERGLARDRRLRCGRCGADWPYPPLRCPFCNQTDHRQLGSLRPAANGDSRRVETCASCRGFLKTIATLQARPADCLPLDDLAGVDLDLAALERGFARPDRPGYPLNVRLVPHPTR